jgi:hypothetical protein
VKHGEVLRVWAAISWYSVGPIITLHGHITAREYMGRLDNQVHPMIQTLCPNNDAVFQDDNAPFTQLELFWHGLKSMKVNLNISLASTTARFKHH